MGNDTVASSAPAVPNLGFLAIVQEPSGTSGGDLVTNPWGRPLEFRLSTAVQPNRIQQIIYGETLRPYICAELIGKTLVDKAAIAVQLVFFFQAEDGIRDYKVTGVQTCALPI